MLIGIDVGTTGTKTILMDDAGTVSHYCYRGYKSYCPQPGIVEQSVSEILDAVKHTVRDCALAVPEGCAVEALSMSLQSGTMIPAREDGTPLGMVISWLDTRCENEARLLNEEYGESYFYRKTGWRLGASFNFIQMVRMCKENPAAARHLKFLSVSDIVTHLFVGEHYTDINDACNEQLLNIEACDWDEDLMEIGGYTRKNLGVLVPTGTYIGNILPERAGELALPSTVRVYAGAQDQFCSAISMDVQRPGDVLLSTGTSWVLMAITDRPAFEECNYPAVMRHIVDNQFANFAYTPAGGSALKWLKNNLLYGAEEAGEIGYDAVTRLAEQVPVGSNGVVFMPHLGGTLYPSWMSRMKGMFYGLDFMHDRRHITRAVLEGVAMEIRLMLDEMKKNGVRQEALKALGGATRSDLWMQIVADVTTLPIQVSDLADMAPIGAALIAAVGSGMYPTYHDACEGFGLLRKMRPFVPNPSASAEYETCFKKYVACYENSMDFTKNH